MKNISFLFSFLFFYSCNSSLQQNSKTQPFQKDKLEIRQMLEKYKDYTIQGNYEGLVDFIYPDVISEFSREKTIEDLKNGMHNSDYDIVVKNIFIDTISEVFINGTNKYAVAKTRSDATFMIKGEVSTATDRQSILYNRFCSDFKVTYGEENVKCDDLSKGVTAVMKSKTYFIFTGKYNRWYMLGDGDPTGVEKNIPIEIRNIEL